MKEQETLSQEKATSQVREEIKANNSLPVLPVHFVQVDDYTTFRAEFAITEGDIVFHFFVNEDIHRLKDPNKYWGETFPNTLSEEAEKYFRVSYPRLKAAFTEEQASWWMRAYGFGKVLDPHRFVYRFLDAFDAALDGAISKAT